MQEWAQVYEEHLEHVYRFLLYFVGNREDAEDLTQDTFLKAYKAWNRFDHRSSVRTWMIAIARNLALDRMRRRQVGSLLKRLKNNEPIAQPPMPEEAVSQRERYCELYAAIQTLKPDYRAVVVLKGIQEYSNRESALILGWSETKVRVTFHRALKALGLTLTNQEEVANELVPR